MMRRITGRVGIGLEWRMTEGPWLLFLANGAPNPVTQRIMMDFNRKITEMDHEYTNVLNVSLDL